MGKENFEKLFTHFSYWVYLILRNNSPGRFLSQDSLHINSNATAELEK